MFCHPQVKEWGCINTTRSNKNNYSQSLDNVCQQATGLLAQNLFPSSCKRMRLHLLNQVRQKKLFSTTVQPVNKQYTNPMTVCPATVIDRFCRKQVDASLPVQRKTGKVQFLKLFFL